MNEQAEHIDQKPHASADDLEEQRLALDWARLRAERQKTAAELGLRRRELAHTSSKKYFELLTNPFTLAILGGFLTLMTGIISNYFSTQNSLWAEREKAQYSAATEKLRAELAAQAANQALQADLIKKFVESPRTETVRENLRFLVDAGLLPTYGGGIKQYLADNPSAAPQVGGMVDFAPGGELVSDVTSARIQDHIARFRKFLQSKGFNDLDERVKAFIYSDNYPPPAWIALPGDPPNSGYNYNNKTLYIHKDLSEDITVALREYAHHALRQSFSKNFEETDLSKNFEQTEVESALADYLPATFLNSPAVGTKTRLPRRMDNVAHYDSTDLPDAWFARGIVWAGALWACRQRVEKPLVDDQVRPAWLQANTSPRERELIAAKFGAALTAAPSPLGECFAEEIARRGLPRSQAP